MVDKSKRQKNFVTEEDISSLLQRYTATTVLALLQEVAQVQDVKIDWNELVKKTSTGIYNAREYQMLWRHLAYHDTLLDRLDDAAQPMDDDSDLECELEAFPAVSCEASAEAAACVKVLMASGVSNDPNGSTVEAPLTINIPKGQMSKASENSQFTTYTQGTNITVPVSVLKQPLPTNTNAEALDSNGAANANLPRRKRKPWTAAEDEELVAAVEKCGEGNWANILKGDFKIDRTASQLSQRWAIIRKKNISNVGTGPQISEVQLATNRALSVALDMPTGDKLKACSSMNPGAKPNASYSKSNLGQHAGTESPAIVTQSLLPAQHDFVSSVAHQLVPSASSKARIAPKKQSTKSNLSPDSMVKAAAVAAGARIATPSDAASLLKAAQSKNAVHIMPGGSLMKSSIGGNSNSLPSNVHFIRTGLAQKPLSSYSTTPANAAQPGGTHPVQGPSAKSAALANQPNLAETTPDTSASSNVKSAAISTSISRIDVKTVNGCSTLSSANIRKGLVQEDKGLPTIEEMEGDSNAFSSNTPMDLDSPGNLSNDQVQGRQASVSGMALQEQVKGDEVSASPNAPVKKVRECQNDPSGSGVVAACDHLPTVGNHVTTKSESINNHTGDDRYAHEEIHVDSQIKEGPVSMVVDGGDGDDGLINPIQLEAEPNDGAK